MSTRILHKRNATANTPPLPGDLVAGELAFNTADGKLYLKRDDNVIIDVSQSIFQRDTSFTVVDNGDSTSGTITADVNGVQKLQVDADGLTIDGLVNINSAETLYFNDADNSAYVGVSVPDVVDRSYIIKMPSELPADTRSRLAIDNNGNAIWDEVNPFESFRVHVSNEFGDDSQNGVQHPVKTVKRAAQLAVDLGRIPTVDPGQAVRDAKRLILDNKEFLVEETIGYTNTTYPVLSYDENEWRRLIQQSIEAVVYDIFLGGNSEAVYVGETANTDITNQTEFVDVLAHLRDITVSVIKNQDIATSYQGLFTQIKVTQLDGSAAETTVITQYDVIRDIITNDTSPAVVEADFQTVPVTIELAGGDFNVDNPVILGDNVAIQGTSSRGVTLRPLNANVDMFRVRNASTIRDVSLRDGLDGNGDPAIPFTWAAEFDDPADTNVDRLGYFGLPRTKPVISTPALFQNVLVVSFLGAGGLHADGSKVDRPPVIPQPEISGIIMRGFAFAISSFGGIGILASNDGVMQVSSCTLSFCQNHIYAQSGGYITATNSGSSFGIYGLRSSGYRSESFLADRGVVADTGTIDGEQFLRVVGTERYAVEDYVIRIRDIGTENDITSTFAAATSTNTFDASADVDAVNDQITITSHGYINGDAVVYTNEGNTSIPGLINGATYYIVVVDANTVELYNDEGLTFAVDITGTSTGTHQFAQGIENFFVDSREDTHSDYQTLVTEAGSFAFQPGDLILGTTGGETNTAYVYSYDDGTDTLVVSNEETSGTKVLFDNTSTITDIAGASVSIAVNSATARTDLRTGTYFVGSTLQGGSMQTISNAEGQIVRFHRPSVVNALSHNWEYAGTGTDFSALNIIDVDTELFDKREDLPGRVYYAGADERGDFRVGGVMTVENRSGKVLFSNGVTIQSANVVELTLNDVTVSEISTDVGLGDNEPGGAQDTRLSTQRAVRSFIANRLGNVLDKNVSTTAVPSALVQLNAQGQINQDLLPPGRGITTYPVSGYESRLDLSLEVPPISVNTGDQAAETYEQQILELTGNITVAKGAVVIQEITNATGVVKEDLSSESTLTLVGPLSGTFNTSDELILDDSSPLGPNSVPTSVGSRNTITDNYFLSTDNESQFLILQNGQTYDFTAITTVTGARSGGEGTITSGPTGGIIDALDQASLVGGSGYTPGSGSETYEFVSLTGGTGTGAIADITVTDGAVTSVDMRRAGSGYVAGDTLSANAADIGGTGSGFSIDVDTVEIRLYVDLTGNKIKFSASLTTPDYIEDANATTNTIADLTASTQQTFDAADTGSGGDVDYSAERITITGHGFVSGDAVEYDNGGNASIGGLTDGNSYWVKAIDVDTIELYQDYALSSGSQVLLGSTSTGVHSLTRYAVDTNINQFYISSHGYSTGTPIRFSAADAPEPIEDDGFYYVGSVTTDGFTLHISRSDALASISGATINPVVLSDTGTGSADLITQNVTVIDQVNTSSTNLSNWSIISQQTIDASNIVSGIISPARLATGTANDETFLRGDNTWQRAVQNIYTPEPSPLNLSGSFFTDTGTDFYYDSIQISIDQVEPGPGPTFSTKGVAAFNKNQFTVNAGQVSVTSGTVNAGQLDGQDGAYYVDPANLSATVPVNKGGTGLTSYVQGDLLYSGAANSLSPLAIGSPNTVLTSNGTIPGWSSSLTLAGGLTTGGAIAVNSTTESTSTTTGSLQTDGGAGIVKNLYVGGNVDVAGTLTVGGNTSIGDTAFNTTASTITLADGSADGTAADGAGLIIDLGTNGTASILYDATNDTLDVNRDVLIDSRVLYVTNAGSTQESIALSADANNSYITTNSDGSVASLQYDLNAGLSGSPTVDLSAATYNSVSLDVSGQDTTPTGLFFSPDGTKLYMVGGGSDSVHQYTLSTGFDLSTASYDTVSLNVSGQDIAPQGVFLNSTGTKMYVVGFIPEAIYQYTLSTGFDLSTASYDSLSHPVSSQAGSPRGVFFNSTGTKMFVIGNDSDAVHQYSLSTGFDITTVTYDSVSFSVAGQDLEPRDLFFNSDGTKMFVIGQTNDSVYQYTLSTGFDVSTASYDSLSFSVAGQDTGPQGLFFSDDTSTMYVAGTSTASVYQYSGIATGGTSSTGTIVFSHDGTTTTATIAGSRVLTEADFGAGNGIDADTLDGQDGAFYLDFANATNKPDPTLTLTGDVTGSATFTDLGDASLTATVADDSHNHTSLTGVTSIGFNAEGTDSASIETNIVSSTTNFDFKLSDDNNDDKWRWRFNPNGASEYSAMELQSTSNTTAELTVNGAATVNTVNIGQLSTQSAATASTSSTTQTELFSFPIASYRSAKVNIQAAQGNFVHTTELLIAHNGTTAFATEYGVLTTDGLLFTVDVDINSGNLRILITAESATLTDYTATYTLIV